MPHGEESIGPSWSELALASCTELGSLQAIIRPDVISLCLADGESRRRHAPYGLGSLISHPLARYSAHHPEALQIASALGRVSNTVEFPTDLRVLSA